MQIKKYLDKIVVSRHILKYECDPGIAGRKEPYKMDEEREVLYCADCGEEIDSEDYYNADEEAICESCADHYQECQDCGEIVHDDDMVRVRDRWGDDVYVCESCAEDYYTECDDCHELVRNDAILTYSDMHLCTACFSERWYECQECGEPVLAEEACYCNGEPYHEACQPAETIHEYHYKPTPHYYKLEKENNWKDYFGYYGVELEIDNGDYPEDTAADILSVGNDGDERIYIKHDGSLNDDGMEIVTHPMTLAYHMDVMPWDAVCQTALEHDYRSHDTNTCGLHVHASRTLFGPDDGEYVQDLNIAKCMLLIDRWWTQYIVPFTRRDYSKLDQWAHKPDAGICPDDDQQTCCQKVCNCRDKGRYQAINLKNDATVEFRMFRGTLKATTILATLQWIDTLIKYVSMTDLSDLQNTTWEDVFGSTWTDLFLQTHCPEYYQELKAYLKNRSLGGK